MPGQYSATLTANPLLNANVGTYIVTLRVFLPDNQDFTFITISVTVTAASITPPGTQFTPANLAFYRVFDGEVVADVAEPTVSPAIATNGMTAIWKYKVGSSAWVNFPSSGSYSAITIVNTPGARKIKVLSNHQN